MPPARGEVAPPALLDWNSTSELQRSECFGSFERERGGHHREPDQGPGAAQHRRRNGGLRAARRRQQPPQGRPDAASGSTSPTTSTSPSGARRARTAPTTSPRAGRWRSKGGSTGASGRPKTAAANGRRSRSSPTPSSSSAPATAPAASGGGNGGGFTPSSDVPADTSDFEGAAAGCGGGGGAKTTSRSRPARRPSGAEVCSIRVRWLELERASSDNTARTSRRRSRAPAQVHAGQRRGRRLQGPQPAAALPLRQGEDPRAPRHRTFPPPPAHSSRWR